MNTKQLISAGFAITAFAAASIPALGGALVPDLVESPPLVMATASTSDASVLPVVVRSDVPSPLPYTTRDW